MNQLRYHEKQAAIFLPARKAQMAMVNDEHVTMLLHADASLFLQAWGLDAFAPPLGS